MISTQNDARSILPMQPQKPGEHDERTAIARLVEAYWEPVMRYFWKRTSREDAEDMAQEVFVAACRAVRHGAAPNPADVEGWRRYLYFNAKNRLVDYWRRKGVRPGKWMVDVIDGESFAQSRGPGSTNEGVAKESGTSRDQTIAIRDCMSELEPSSRFSCWMLFVEGRSQREIAGMIDKPESTLRTILVRAVADLRTCLERKGLAPAS